MGVPLCLRDSVKLAVDVKDSARANAQIDRIIADVSRVIERSLCRRVFYPRIMTQTFDWPDPDRPTPWRLWLGGQSELASVSAVSAGGVSILTSAVKLYPTYGPPYTRLELDQSSTASFSTAGTYQQAISVTGVFAGAPLDESTVATLIEGLDDSETDIDVDAANTVGPGALIRIGTERMLVTGSSALDTGINLGSDIAAQMNATAVPLSTTVGAPRPLETIAIGAERMLVTDVIGSTAYVRRAYDGTPIAAHTTGADIYAYRTLTVERGVLGTTAATHPNGSLILRWLPPGPVQGLAVAETLNQLEQERSAYARVIGTGDQQRESRGAGLKEKRDDVRRAYGRRVRMGAV
jgi:hypothetical protein